MEQGMGRCWEPGDGGEQEERAPAGRDGCLGWVFLSMSML